MNRESRYPPQPFDDELLFSLRQHECPKCGGKQCRKPLIRVVCPICAGVVMANALDTEGSTESLCSKCDNTTIAVSTDEFGCISGIEGWKNEKEKDKPIYDWQKILLGLIAALLLLNFLHSLATSSSGRAGTAETAQPSVSQKTGDAAEAEASLPVADVNQGAAAPKGDAASVPESSPTPAALDMFAPNQN